MSMEINFLRRSARSSRLQKIRNIVIREKMNINDLVLDFMRYKQLNWYGHVQTMNEERLPRKILQLCPLGRKRTKVGPPNLWM